MAKNNTLELSIKIAGQVDKSLLSAVQTAQNSISSLSMGINHMGTAGLASVGAVAAGTAATIATCTREAAKYENYMADVVKYVDGLAEVDPINHTVNLDPQNYEAMRDAILDLSTQIPYTHQDLTRLAAAAGEAGKNFEQIVEHDDRGNVTGFLRNVAMAGTAMDVSADQAGDWAAKWETAFQMSHDEIMVLFDQINYLGAHSATTAAEIAHAVNEAASLGQIGGVDVATTTAMATAMLSTGVSMDVVGTTLKRVFANMTSGETATKRVADALSELGLSAAGVARAMQVDGSGTLLKIFQAIQQMPEERQLATLSNLFGQWAIEGTGKMVGNLEAYTNVLDAVNDPSKYTGSMEKEFIIKATTPEAVSMMRDNAWTALQIEFGTAFLPAQKEINLAMIDFMNEIRRDMPELEALANSLGAIASNGVRGLGEAMSWSLPHIQRGMDYLANNGDQVASVLAKLAAVFVAMKMAPAAEMVLTGAGGLLFGSGVGGNAGKRTGGLLGGIGQLFKGGQRAAAAGGGLLSAAYGASVSNGVLATLGATASSLISGNGVRGTTGLLQAAAGTPGLLSGYTGVWSTLAGAAANSRAGKYFGGIGTSLGEVGRTRIGSGIIRGTKAVGKTTLEVLANIAGPGGLGLTSAAGAVLGAARSGAGWVAGKAGTLAGMAAGSKVGQTAIHAAGAARTGLGHLGAIAGGWLGNVGSFAGASLGLMNSVTGIGSLMAGLLPVAGVLSVVIASVSLLSDKLGGLHGILDNVRGMIVGRFGEEAGETFDGIAARITNAADAAKGLFAEGGVENALSGLRGKLFGEFDQFTESYSGGFFTGDTAAMLVGLFDGGVQILQTAADSAGKFAHVSNEMLKPVLLDLFQFITGTAVPVILQTLTAAAPYAADVIGALGSAIVTGVQIMGSAIQAGMPIAQGIIAVILTIGSVAIPAALAAFAVFGQGVGDLMAAIQAAFNGLLNFINGVFSGNWKQAWSGITQIFGGAFDALVTLCKTPINAVITLINKAISGINSLGITIPEWVPEFGGQTFGINIPEIPMLARGGFTRGVSIAGEAGTEAVISFLPSVRGANIGTWIEAGRMLGVDSGQAAQAVGGQQALSLPVPEYTRIDQTTAVEVPAVIQSGYQVFPAQTQGAAETLIWTIPGIVYQAIREIRENHLRTVELERVERPERERDDPNRDGGTYTITYSPTIVIQGDADRDEIERILREDKDRFDRWWEEKQRKERRVRFA